MNIQNFLLQTLATLITSGFISTYIIKKLERSDTKYNYGKMKAIVFLEEIYPKYTFINCSERSECIKKLSEFTEEIKSYKLTAYLFELYEHALFLVTIDEEQFDEEYKLFQIRYQRTVNIFRSRVGRYAVSARVVEGDYSTLMLFVAPFMLPLSIYLAVISTTFKNFINYFLLLIFSFMFLFGIIILIVALIMTCKYQLRSQSKRRKKT